MLDPDVTENQGVSERARQMQRLAGEDAVFPLPFTQVDQRVKNQPDRGEGD